MTKGCIQRTIIYSIIIMLVQRTLCLHIISIKKIIVIHTPKSKQVVHYCKQFTNHKIARLAMNTNIGAML